MEREGKEVESKLWGFTVNHLKTNYFISTLVQRLLNLAFSGLSLSF